MVIMNNELGWMNSEEIMVYFKVLFQQGCGEWILKK